MKTKFYYLIIIVVSFTFSISSNAQLKSIERVRPFFNVNDFTTATGPVVICDAGEGQWWIGDGDPNSKIANTQWSILKGDAATYDEEKDDYVVELVGHRKDASAEAGSDEYKNINSFMLWSQTDSGVPWNLTNSKVRFEIKITDGEDWTFGNDAAYEMGIYMWVAIEHEWDNGVPKAKWIKLQQGDSLKFLDPTYNQWSDYIPTGLGNSLADGNWHTYELDLIKVIENAKQTCIDNGNTDGSLVPEGTEGVKWHWHGVLGMEIYGLNVCIGKVEVLPNTATKISNPAVKELVTVYPNPSVGAMTLTGISGNAFVDVYDLTGSKVASFNDVVSGSRLSLNDLAKGAYLIKVRDENNTTIKKIVIAK